MTGTTDPADGTSGDPEAIYESLRSEIDRVLIGNDEAVEYLTIALLTRGHLLLEGVPASPRRRWRTSSHGRPASTTTGSR